MGRLEKLGASLHDIGHLFVTHGHFDHLPDLPGRHQAPLWEPLPRNSGEPLPEIRCRPCPGHAPDLVALVFNTGQGECWIVGDAIIAREWFCGWQYYWPNGYAATEIAQTWNSMAAIVSCADVVIPGHGAPFAVTSALIEEALDNWRQAGHYDLCPDVERVLRKRLEALNALKGLAHNRR